MSKKKYTKEQFYRKLRAQDDAAQKSNHVFGMFLDLSALQEHQEHNQIRMRVREYAVCGDPILRRILC